MIRPVDIITTMATCGFDTVVTVPCSSIAGLLAELSMDARFSYLSATSEAEAVGVAAGAYLAGRSPILVMQNSGFCDALNVIASLLDPFAIPLPFLVTGRGAFGAKDEPQHRLIGANFARIADAFELPFLMFPFGVEELGACFLALRASAEASGRGAVLAVPVGAIGDAGAAPLVLKGGAPTPSPLAVVTRDTIAQPAHRRLAIGALRTAASSDAVFVATTGYTGRELFAAGDRDTNLYLAGSMGCASAVGLGLALFGASMVVALDGDGAFLMRMGNCATVGVRRPAGFVHVVLNNGVYASTGGQPSFGRQVDLAGIAQACGYATVVQTSDYSYAADLIQALEAGEAKSPLFLDLWVRPDLSPDCARPNVAPSAQAARLRSCLIERPSPFAEGPGVRHGRTSV